MPGSGRFYILKVLNNRIFCGLTCIHNLIFFKNPISILKAKYH